MNRDRKTKLGWVWGGTMAHLEKDNIFQCFTQLFKNWGNHLARPTPEILFQIHPKSVWDNCYQVAKKSTTTSFSPAAVTWDGISDNNQHDWDDPNMHQYQPKTSEKPTWFLKSSVSVTACTMFELSRTLQVGPQSKPSLLLNQSQTSKATRTLTNCGQLNTHTMSTPVETDDKTFTC